MHAYIQKNMYHTYKAHQAQRKSIGRICRVFWRYGDGPPHTPPTINGSSSCKIDQTAFYTNHTASKVDCQITSWPTLTIYHLVNSAGLTLRAVAFLLISSLDKVPFDGKYLKALTFVKIKSGLLVRNLLSPLSLNLIANCISCSVKYHSLPLFFHL